MEGGREGGRKGRKNVPGSVGVFVRVRRGPGPSSPLARSPEEKTEGGREGGREGRRERGEYIQASHSLQTKKSFTFPKPVTINTSHSTRQTTINMTRTLKLAGLVGNARASIPSL